MKPKRRQSFRLLIVNLSPRLKGYDMTQGHSTDSRAERQEKSQDNTAELIRLACQLLRILIQWATSKAATRIGRRVNLLSQAAWLPSSGQGDTNAIAACLNLAEISTDQQLTKNKVPHNKPGQSRLFRFSDVAKSGTRKAVKP